MRRSSTSQAAGGLMRRLVVGIAMAAAWAVTTPVQAGVLPVACSQSSPVIGYWHSSCTFVANGSHPSVQAAGQASIRVTYSVLTPILPADVSTHVRVRRPDGTILADCRVDSLSTAACRHTATAPVAAGTLLLCEAGFTTSIGAATYACTD